MKSLEVPPSSSENPSPDEPVLSPRGRSNRLDRRGSTSSDSTYSSSAHVATSSSFLPLPASPSVSSSTSSTSSSLSSSSTSSSSPSSSTWGSFLGLLSWGKLPHVPLSLVKMFEEGRHVCALCPSSEDELGFFIGRVTQVEKDSQENQFILRLAKLKALQPDQEGLPGCQYFTTAEVFYAKASELQHIPMQIEDLGGAVHPEQTTLQLYTLGHQVLGVLNDSVSVASEESFRTQVSVSPQNQNPILRVVQLLPGEDKITTIPMDLDSPEEIERTCRQLINSLSLSIDARPAFIDGVDQDCSSPVDLTQAGWKFALEQNGIKLYHKPCRDQNFLSFMAQVVLEASPIETKYLVKQSTNREKFDEMCRRSGVVQTIDDNTVVVNFVDTKFLLNRDFCIIRHDHTMRDGTVFLASNSIETSQCPRKKYTRAEVFDSGWKLQPQGKGSCLMTYITNCDLKLWAPTMFLEVVIRAQLLSVCGTIRENLAKARYNSSLNQLGGNPKD